ncbi:unnamed protein product [Polarella glacialis]|uniref:LicD/FKTN/FKRP nucleotidyltransferase domain-containing protein n=1 Tax=Polarella glacialis TaxID=89957 RepID=A0A813FHI1_POLGL|nr:unnamed protein product [Polarella glacialis]
MTVRCLRPEWLRFALVMALQLVLCQQGADGKIVYADGSSADSCPGLESEPFREISRLLEHSQIRVDFFDHFYPKVLAVPDSGSSCFFAFFSICLYSYFVTCSPAYSGRVSDMSKNAFPSCWEAGTFLDASDFIGSFLNPNWVAIVASPARVVFPLFSSLQGLWHEQSGTSLEGCSPREAEVAEALFDKTDTSLAAGYLLSRYLEGMEMPAKTLCGTVLETVSWLMLGASDVRPDALSLAQRQPLSSCAAINKAQLNLRLFCNRSGMFEREADHSLGTDLLALHTKLYPLLAKMAQHCYEFRELGNLPSSLFDNPNDQGLAEEERNWTGVVKELAAGRLLLPFQPLFGAARREWMLRVHSAFQDVLGKLRIPYSLMRGPILGVVRHHGFLPWENDSDVCVPVEFAQELLILALLGLQGLDLPEACLQDQRCQELAEAAARLRSVGVRLLSTWIVEKNMQKFIFFAEEDAAAVMNNSRRVEDPVIDVYLCKGWPGLSGESEMDESGILIPHEVIFPLQRTYFSGLSSWAYRKRRQVMDERYGVDWPKKAGGMVCGRSVYPARLFTDTIASHVKFLFRRHHKLPA